MSKKNKENNVAGFAPGSESQEQFNAVLERLQELLAKKSIKIEVDTDGDLEFVLGASAIEALKKQECAGLTGEQILQVVSTEMNSLLCATLFEDEESGIKRNVPGPILKSVGIPEYVERLHEFKKRIVLPESIIHEATFRMTAKGLLYRGISWETSEKLYDKDLGSIGGVRYARVSFLYTQPTTELIGARLLSPGISIQIPSNAEPKEVTLEVQKKDIEKIIESLQKVVEKLDE